MTANAQTPLERFAADLLQTESVQQICSKSAASAASRQQIRSSAASLQHLDMVEMMQTNRQHLQQIALVEFGCSKSAAMSAACLQHLQLVADMLQICLQQIGSKSL